VKVPLDPMSQIIVGDDNSEPWNPHVPHTRARRRQVCTSGRDTAVLGRLAIIIAALRRIDDRAGFHGMRHDNMIKDCLLYTQ
jgi:hypothetical protein